MQTKQIRLNDETIESLKKIAEGKNQNVTALIRAVLEDYVKSDEKSQAPTLTEKRIEELMREKLKKECFKTEGLKLSLGNSQVKYKPEDFENKEIDDGEIPW